MDDFEILCPDCAVPVELRSGIGSDGQPGMAVIFCPNCDREAVNA